MQRLIWVKFQRKGFHCYPNAPEDVSYLRDRHRHLFLFKIMISVEHNEREIEFHQFQTWLESMYESGVLIADNKSCETLAEELIIIVDYRYPNRRIIVEVSEDGECGSIVTNQH